MTYTAEIDTQATKMPEDMLQFGIETTQQALVTYSNNRTELARFIRTEFDAKYGKFWGVIVGDDFSGSLTNEKPYLAVFRMHSSQRCCRFIIFKNAEK